MLDPDAVKKGLMSDQWDCARFTRGWDRYMASRRVSVWLRVRAHYDGMTFGGSITPIATIP